VVGHMVPEMGYKLEKGMEHRTPALEMDYNFVASVQGHMLPVRDCSVEVVAGVHTAQGQAHIPLDGVNRLVVVLVQGLGRGRAVEEDMLIWVEVVEEPRHRRNCNTRLLHHRRWHRNRRPSPYRELVGGSEL